MLARTRKAGWRRTWGMGLALGMIVAVGGAGPAFAGDPMSDNDSGVRTAPLPEIPAWKLDLVALHGKQVAGTLSRADAQRYMTILAEQGLNPGGAIVVSASSTGGTITPMSASYDAKSMTKTQKPQLQNNWCGPAAAQSIVLAWHNAKSYSTTSKFDGQALSQKALSGSDYTNAGASGGTDWDDLDMLHALNRWMWGGGVVKYYQTEPDTAAEVKDKVTSDLDIDWMVAADMIEPAGNAGLHYNHHPVDKTIKHWTSIYGYQSRGDTLLFQDPVFGSSAISWSGQVNQTFSLTDDKTFDLMTHNTVARRGIAW